MTRRELEITTLFNALANLLDKPKGKYERGYHRCTLCRRWYRHDELINGRKCPVCNVDTRSSPRVKNRSQLRYIEPEEV